MKRGGKIALLECGYKFASNTCPKCGETLPEGAKFCLECGEKI